MSLTRNKVSASSLVDSTTLACDGGCGTVIQQSGGMQPSVPAEWAVLSTQVESLHGVRVLHVCVACQLKPIRDVLVGTPEPAPAPVPAPPDAKMPEAPSTRGEKRA